uniref:Uncharacterized protein n=1 Tax=Panagrolaimus superbus TaxID=310955 RepID=A0A914YCQ3_9BILA
MLISLFLWSTLLLGTTCDFVRSPSLKQTDKKHIVKRQSNRFLVDEVGDDTAKSNSVPNSDDYSDFNNKPVENRASRKLRPVTYRPILPTYRTPRPSHRFPAVELTTLAPITAATIPPHAVRRVGYFFQHYPYDKLHRFYQLNPRLQFFYPREYENVEWSYPIERTPYYHQRQFYNLAALGYYGRK